MAKKFHVKLAYMILGFITLLGVSALIVWWQERNFTGSYFDSLWTVLFTLIGQGEFATSPHTFIGRITVFLLSIFGVAVLGVVFADVMQRIINSRVKEILGEMMGINTCKFEGHVIICGWNARGPYLVPEILSSGMQAALIAKDKPENLPEEVFYVRGNPSERERLIQAGIMKASKAIILGDSSFGEDDSHSILTALAVEDTAPEVYTVMEIRNPENERYAHYAHVDDILYSDSLIAGITSMCANNEGISPFIRDILSTADDGYSFSAVNVPDEYLGKKISDLFDAVREQDGMPVGILTPPFEGALYSEWESEVNPPVDRVITLPMKVVCIVKDSYDNK